MKAEAVRLARVAQSGSRATSSADSLIWLSNVSVLSHHLRDVVLADQPFSVGTLEDE